MNSDTNSHISFISLVVVDINDAKWPPTILNITTYSILYIILVNEHKF